LEQLSGKVNQPEFMVDILLEEWPEDRDSESLFQRVQYLFSVTSRTRNPRKRSSTTTHYTEEENDIIKDAVKGYLQVPRP
jgi:hypothetical protein